VERGRKAKRIDEGKKKGKGGALRKMSVKNEEPNGYQRSRGYV